jgi:hypothetical protein
VPRRSTFPIIGTLLALYATPHRNGSMDSASQRIAACKLCPRVFSMRYVALDLGSHRSADLRFPRFG